MYRKVFGSGFSHFEHSYQNTFKFRQGHSSKRYHFSFVHFVHCEMCDNYKCCEASTREKNGLEVKTIVTMIIILTVRLQQRKSCDEIHFEVHVKTKKTLFSLNWMTMDQYLVGCWTQWTPHYCRTTQFSFVLPLGFSRKFGSCKGSLSTKKCIQATRSITMFLEVKKSEQHNRTAIVKICVKRK